MDQGCRTEEKSTALPRLRLRFQNLVAPRESVLRFDKATFPREWICSPREGGRFLMRAEETPVKHPALIAWIFAFLLAISLDAFSPGLHTPEQSGSGAENHGEAMLAQPLDSPQTPARQDPGWIGAALPGGKDLLLPPASCASLILEATPCVPTSRQLPGAVRGRAPPALG